MPGKRAFEPVPIKLSGRDRWLFVAGKQLGAADHLKRTALELRNAGEHYGLQPVMTVLAQQIEREAAQLQDDGRLTLLKIVNYPEPPPPAGAERERKPRPVAWWRWPFHRGRGGV